jgi:hypothetical protein
MTERKDVLTASRVDLVLILLPIINHFEASCALAASGVSLEVAARVLATPAERRAMLQQKCDCSSGSDTMN